MQLSDAVQIHSVDRNTITTHLTRAEKTTICIDELITLNNFITFL